MQEPGLFSLDKRRLRGYCQCVLIPGEAVKKMDWVQMMGERGKLTCRKFYFKCFFFTMRVIKHWHRMPTDSQVESPYFILKTQLDIVLGNLLQVTLLRAGMFLSCGMIVKAPDNGREENKLEQMQLSHPLFWWRQNTHSNSKARLNQMQSKENRLHDSRFCLILQIKPGKASGWLDRLITRLLFLG